MANPFQVKIKKVGAVCHAAKRLLCFLLALSLFLSKVKIEICSREVFVDIVQDELPIMPLAIWALVLGIASLLFCCLLLAIPAIICGHLARSRIKQAPGTASGSGMAMAGLIMGYVSVVAFILACILGIITALTIPAAIKLRDKTQRNACRQDVAQFSYLAGNIFDCGQRQPCNIIATQQQGGGS